MLIRAIVALTSLMIMLTKSGMDIFSNSSRSLCKRTNAFLLSEFSLSFDAPTGAPLLGRFNSEGIMGGKPLIEKFLVVSGVDNC